MCYQPRSCRYAVLQSKCVIVVFMCVQLQQPYMLAAIREMVEKKDEFTQQSHVCTAEYLEACNLIFENGILSHEMICSLKSKSLVNISEGMKWFFKWKEVQKEPGKIIPLVSSPGLLMGRCGQAL